MDEGLEELSDVFGPGPCLKAMRGPWLLLSRRCGVVPPGRILVEYASSLLLTWPSDPHRLAAGSVFRQGPSDEGGDVVVGVVLDVGRVSGGVGSRVTRMSM